MCSQAEAGAVSLDDLSRDERDLLGYRLVIAMHNAGGVPASPQLVGVVGVANATCLTSWKKKHRSEIVCQRNGRVVLKNERTGKSMSPEHGAVVFKDTLNLIQEDMKFWRDILSVEEFATLESRTASGEEQPPAKRRKTTTGAAALLKKTAKALYAMRDGGIAFSDWCGNNGVQCTEQHGVVNDLVNRILSTDGQGVTCANFDKMANEMFPQDYAEVRRKSKSNSTTVFHVGHYHKLFLKTDNGQFFLEKVTPDFSD